MNNRPWHDKTMELVKRHKLGFLYNPGGGGQFTRYDSTGIHPIINIQISTWDDQKDYEKLLLGLQKLGLEL